VIGEAEYSSYGKEATTLHREILKQLGTEELVEIIIDQGKSIENLTNRVE
jgi:hypothetical protein